MKVAENRTPSWGEIAKELITEHDTTMMDNGVQYYKNKNDIRDREITYYKKGNEVRDPTATNNKLSHNWHKLLVKQKMGYMVGKPVTFASAHEDAEEEEEFVEKVNEVLGEEFDDKMNELVKGFSNKGVEWLHVYIGREGGFRYTIIDAREIIPIWETRKQEELDGVIRYYTMQVNGEDRIRAEYWTKDEVRYFMEDTSGHLLPDDSVEENPQSHFYKVRQVGNEQVRNGDSWGKVPFIPFKNNKEMLSDLNDYKELIDAYDKSRSDLDNNLEDIQDLIYVLKNYGGESLSDFLHNLKYYRSIKVDGDGGVDTIQAEIPVEAKKEHIETLAEDIFMFGQGVNIKTDRFGNSPSGVALQFLYAQLDLKCDTAERKAKRAIRTLLWFLAKYYEVTERKEYEPDSVVVRFNKSMITNEAEKIESAQASQSMLDPLTILQNHPWVDDPQQVKQRLEDAYEDYIDLDDLAGELNDEPEESEEPE